MPNLLLDLNEGFKVNREMGEVQATDLNMAEKKPSHISLATYTVMRVRC